MADKPKLGSGKRNAEKPAPDPKKSGKKKIAALLAAGRKRTEQRGG